MFKILSLPQIYKKLYMKNVISLTFLILSVTLFAQDKYEYFGVVSLNGDSQSVISYRLVFTETDGKIAGYSVTDMAGEHETKNVISGTYDEKTKAFNFREEDILYTKSPISDDMFCFINFTGKVKLMNENSTLSGDFKGLFKNNTKCIDGSIKLLGSDKLYNKMNKMNRKLQRSNRFDEDIKRRANPVALLDSLKINSLIKGQNLNVFVKSDKVLLEIWDAGKEDGDMIQLYQNGKILLKDYKVTNKKKVITLNIQKENIFKITASNEGEISPNTAMIQLIDEKRKFELMSNLKEGESATITILKSAE